MARHSSAVPRPILFISSAAESSESEQAAPCVRASIRGRRSAYERAAHVRSGKFETSRQAPSRLRRAPHWRQTRAPTCGKPLPARLLGLCPPCLGRPRRAVRLVQAIFCNLNECVYTVYTRPRTRSAVNLKDTSSRKNCFPPRDRA